MRSEPPSRPVEEDFRPIPDVDRLTSLLTKLQWDTEPKNRGTGSSGSAETESFFGYLKGSGTFHGWTTFGGTFFLRVEG